LTFPHGFKASTTNVPFLAKEINKKKVLQFTCIRMDVKSKWTALYTKNPICGHPVTIGRNRIKQGKPIKALWINNKIANVGVAGGFEDAEDICLALANTLNCDKNEVIPLSTGIIGWRLPREDIISHISYVVNGSISVNEAAKAIMTTDSYPKAYREKLSNGGSIVGIAKGAGMVEPNLATTIIILMTDVDCEQEFLNKALKAASEKTFNCISIDGDTSTSDCAILISSCLKTAVEEDEFSEALTKVCAYLARQIVWNGEGISHVIEVRVKNCPDVKTGKLIGKNVVNSPLTKSAISGNDPNIGRIVGSMGRLIDNVDWSIVNVKLGQHYIFVQGKIIDWDIKIENEMTEYLKNCQIYEDQNKPAYPVHDNSVVIEIELNQGENDVTIIGGDLTIDYVKINGNYRS
jgi:glutamate N-acetyltransferase/amino-acid N-acetyltransferase